MSWADAFRPARKGAAGEPAPRATAAAVIPTLSLDPATAEGYESERASLARLRFGRCGISGSQGEGRGFESRLLASVLFGTPVIAQLALTPKE